MFTQISLLKVSAGASLLEYEHTAQDFLIAADNVFYKAQGLAMLAPLHKTVFGLLEGLLDDWNVLGLDFVEWRQCGVLILGKQWRVCFSWSLVSALADGQQVSWKHSMAIELELTAPVAVPKASMAPAPTPVSVALSIHLPFLMWLSHLVHLCMSSLLDGLLLAARVRAKAKAIEEDDDDEDEATQTLREELENFVVPTTVYYHCQWNIMRDMWACHKAQGFWVEGMKKCPPIEVLLLAKHVKLVWAAKAFLKHQGKPSQFFILEGFKEKGKSNALIAKLEQMGAKRAFKSKETVESDSDEEEEEERVCMIKKMKCKHIKEPIGMSKEKEAIEL
ncbi:hypothetical protein C0995_009216 [Termitomyces sp. Mi166|nr:hypothetical protein C0995_009216 [Termitomyces sp. Mi166\